MKQTTTLHTLCTACGSVKSKQAFNILNAPFTCNACSRTKIVCVKCKEAKNTQSFRQTLTAAQARQAGNTDPLGNPSHRFSPICKACQPQYHSERAGALKKLPSSQIHIEANRGRISESAAQIELDRRGRADISDSPPEKRADYPDYASLRRWTWWHRGDVVPMNARERIADVRARNAARRADPDRDPDIKLRSLKERHFLPILPAVKEPRHRARRVSTPYPKHPWYNNSSLANQIAVVRNDVRRFRGDVTPYGRASSEWALAARTALAVLVRVANLAVMNRVDSSDTPENRIVQTPTYMLYHPEMYETLGARPMDRLLELWYVRQDLASIEHAKPRDRFTGKWGGRPLGDMPMFMFHRDTWIFERVEDLHMTRKDRVALVRDSEVPEAVHIQYSQQLAAYHAACAAIDKELDK